MIRKSSFLSNINSMKRQKVESCSGSIEEDAPKDTRSALKYVSSIFPAEKFQKGLPPIVLRHQLYAFIKCRTEVDKCLNDMRKKNEVRLFRIGQKDDEVAVVYMKDYKEYVEKCCPNNAVIGNFLNVVTQCPDISFQKKALMNVYDMKEENISELVRQGVLTLQDVGCYFLSIPHVGEFVRAFMYGQRAILQHIKRTKYKEISQTELLQRKLPSKCLLGIQYHIYDAIGADLVTCMETSSGIVLRLNMQGNRH